MMALVTGIWWPELDRQIRPGQAKAVIPPDIHDHIGSSRHVAVYALGPGRVRFVVVVRGGIESGRTVTGVAGLVESGLLELAAVWIVAIGAFDALAVHLALQERPVLIVLFEDLAVSMIDVLVQKHRHKCVQEMLARLIFHGDRAAAGMARSAGLDLDVGAGATFPVQSGVIGIDQSP